MVQIVKGTMILERYLSDAGHRYRIHIPSARGLISLKTENVLASYPTSFINVC